MRNLFLVLFYLILSFLAFSFANLIVNGQFWMDGHAYPSLLLTALISVLISFWVTTQNRINATTQIPQLLTKLMEYMFVFSFLVLLYWFSVNSINYSKEHIAIFLSLTLGFLFVFNYVYIRYLRRKFIGIKVTNTIVVGEGEFTKQFINSIENNNWIGFDFKQQFKPSDFALLDLKSFLTQNNIASVIINWDEFEMSEERELALRNLTETNGVKFYAISEIFSAYLMPSAYKLAGNFPYIQLFTFPLDKAINASFKRLFDIFFAFMFFIGIALWLFPIIILILVLNQGFPIFFSQKRNGTDGSVFKCYKFRTMVQNPFSNKQITVQDDPRVTRVGRLLRRTSLDELPQFWNVLIGDMSVVGPRPHMLNQNEHYNQIIAKYNFRHYVKPGITGMAQVEGYRGEVKENIDMENRVQSDLYYIRNWSLRLDLMIIYRTVSNMLQGDEKAI